MIIKTVVVMWVLYDCETLNTGLVILLIYDSDIKHNTSDIKHNTCNVDIL